MTSLNIINPSFHRITMVGIALLQVILLGGKVALVADATSIKMDYLPIGHGRVDPILKDDCLSDHVHTFYGPQSGMDPRRIDSTDELELHSRLVATDVSENTGNVEENKSLYWHPTVYKYDRTTDTYTRDIMAGSSAYYVWETGETRAFPKGFQMIAGFDRALSEANAECVDEEPCDEGDCYTENSFFPVNKCSELEVSMRMPNCWDGVNINSPPTHTSHVTYGDVNFPGHECPPSHPIKIPQIHLFFRIIPYNGGWHTFSDGTSTFHADYVSGWDEDFLQDVLDGCENEGDGAMPNHFCDDFLTFRDGPKCKDEDTCDFADPALAEKIRAIQPDPVLNVAGTIVAEETEVIVGNLPRGTCNGPLFGEIGHIYNETVSANLKPASTDEFIGESSDEGDDDDDDCSEDEEGCSEDDGDHEDDDDEDDWDDSEEDEDDWDDSEEDDWDDSDEDDWDDSDEDDWDDEDDESHSDEDDSEETLLPSYSSSTKFPVGYFDDEGFNLFDDATQITRSASNLGSGGDRNFSFRGGTKNSCK